MIRINMHMLLSMFQMYIHMVYFKANSLPYVIVTFTNKGFIIVVIIYNCITTLCIYMSILCYLFFKHFQFSINYLADQVRIKGKFN